MNASKNECKRGDHTIQQTNAKPEAKQTDCEKLRKTFLNSNATWYKNELFLQFYKWVKREETNATIDR